jgi:hypothetical protein
MTDVFYAGQKDYIEKLNDLASSRGNKSPDSKPQYPSAFDDEFDIGTGLDTVGERFSGAAPWQLENIGGTTYDLASGSLLLNVPYTSSRNYRIIYQEIEETDWEITVKQTSVNIPATNFNFTGIYVGTTSSQKHFHFCKIYTVGYKVGAYYGVDDNTFSEGFGEYSIFDSTVGRGVIYPLYMKATKSGDNLTFSYSDSGVLGTYITHCTIDVPSYITTPLDKIGLFGVSMDNSSSGVVGVYDFFRVQV